MTRPRFIAERWALAGVLVFTLLVRGGVLWAMRGNLEQDPDAYREIAENLLRHGEFAMSHSFVGLDGEIRPIPTAYRPPLYPVVLSNLPMLDGQRVSLVKVAMLHLLLGGATVWLTFATAFRYLSTGPLGLNESQIRATATPASRPGLLPVGPPGLSAGGAAGIARSTIAGLVVACDPILLNQQTLIMTETLATFLAILSLWCLARFDSSRSWFNAALAGGAMGLAVLCRPTFLPWLGLVGVGVLVVRGRNSEFKMQNSERDWLNDVFWRVTNLGGLVIAAAAVMSPWVIRNYRVFGKPIVTTTHGGYTLLLGNNFYFYRWLNESHSDAVWNASELEKDINVHVPSIAYGTTAVLLGNEPRMDRQLYRNAMQCMEREPITFTKACVYRIMQLSSPLPHKLTKDESMGRRMLRYATCAWYCGVYAMAAIGVWRLICARGTPQRALIPATASRGPTALFQPQWVWGVLLCFAFTAVHTFYWTNMRMRAPLMPFIAIVAAAGLSGRLCFSITSGGKSYAEA